jgi:hypothetical protein
VIVPWHTGDYALDQLYPNSGVCPRLTSLQSSIYSSPEWTAYNNSAEVKALNQNLNNILGKGSWFWSYTMDCMMTTVCSNRQLPEGMTESIFNETIGFIEKQQSFLNLYNDSQWAKLSMGNTAWHIKNNIVNFLDGSKTYKFALFGGHDTTIQPFLSAVAKYAWDNHWPGYASMLSIELYSKNPDAPADTPDNLFRLVYNSQVITIPGCDDALCDVNVLLDSMDFGHEFMACTSAAAAPAATTTCDNGSDSKMSQTDWVIITVLSTLLGGLIGASLVVFLNKQYFDSELGREYILADGADRA